MPRAVFDIFLSSTSKDLKPYRDKVAEMVERMRQTTIRMERFGAKPSKPLATCKEEVLACDALIVILGHRYGWVPSVAEGGDGERSITWWEVTWALEVGKPVYAFDVDPAAAWAQDREQDQLLGATTDAQAVAIGRAVRRLRAFRDYVGQQTTRELYSSPDDLGSKVVGSLHVWLLEQAVAAAHAEHAQAGGKDLLAGAAPALAAPAKRGVGSRHKLPAAGLLRWQEQLHLISAWQDVDTAVGVRIALIAGRANAQHPALAGATLRPLDVRSHGSGTAADDFTTGLAALLVGHGAGYRGVAARAELQVLQVLNKAGGAGIGDILTALDAAIRGGAQVVCLPWGGAGFARSHYFAPAAAQGVILACPAGNDGGTAAVYPAAFPFCISATSLDAHGALTPFANHGAWVTTSAPALEVPVASGANRYETCSGSSYACAALAGVAALMLRADPGLTVQRIATLLRSTGAPALDAKRAKAAGTLRTLDAQALVRAALDGAKAGAVQHRPARKRD